MAKVVGWSYGEKQSNSESMTDSYSSDDEYPDSSSTAGRSMKQYYTLEMEWLKRNKNISRQERRKIQQEIQKGCKPGEPMTSLLSLLMFNKRDWIPQH